MASAEPDWARSSSPQTARPDGLEQKRFQHQPQTAARCNRQKESAPSHTVHRGAARNAGPGSLCVGQPRQRLSQPQGRHIMTRSHSPRAKATMPGTVVRRRMVRMVRRGKPAPAPVVKTASRRPPFRRGARVPFARAGHWASEHRPDHQYRAKPSHRLEPSGRQNPYCSYSNGWYRREQPSHDGIFSPNGGRPILRAVLTLEMSPGAKGSRGGLGLTAGMGPPGG